MDNVRLVKTIHVLILITKIVSTINALKFLRSMEHAIFAKTSYILIVKIESVLLINATMKLKF
jgi:hypothetical protein